MKIKAAVIRERNKPYSIEELELESPREKEALVRYAYTGYCHSDMISTHVDIPRLTHMAMTHDLKLDKLITHKFKLEEIDDVADKMLKRQIRGRWVCAFE